MLSGMSVTRSKQVAGAAGPQAQIDVIDDVEGAHDGSGEDVGIRFNRDGTYDVDEGSGYVETGNWTDTPSIFVGDDFEIFMHEVSGGWHNGTVESWVALTTGRTWDMSSLGNADVTFDVDVREVADTGNIDNQDGILFEIVDESE